MKKKFISTVFFLEVAAIAFFVTSMGMLPFALFASCPQGAAVCPSTGVGNIVMVIVFFLLLPETYFLSKKLVTIRPLLFHLIAFPAVIWTVGFFLLM